MAPKVKITRESIIEASLDILRSGGTTALNARSVANALGCSTQPIFSNFSSMEELDEAVTAAAYKIYLDFSASEINSGKYPSYKAMGMAYIRFASEEKELFKLLFMCDRNGEDLSPAEDFNTSVEIIMSATGLTKEAATFMHFEMWTCVHGIATMLATSFLKLESELISTVLSDVYLGVRDRHIKEKQ